jgi:DnaJ-like protein
MNFETNKTFGEQGINSYPLSWPVGWKRQNYRKKSQFSSKTFARVRDTLFHELKLMGVPDWNVVLSTSIPLRRDGLPYSGMAQPNDPGVAVYFRYKEKPMVFACDNYGKVEDNLYAICKTIEAIRGMKRWGASEMMERTFSGFQALPPAPTVKPKKLWWEVLGVKRGDHPDRIKAAYRALAHINHPDRGGDPAKMSEINSAYEESQQ